VGRACSACARPCAAPASRITSVLRQCREARCRQTKDRAHEPPRRPAHALRRVVRPRREGCAQTIRVQEAVARKRARVCRSRFGGRIRVCGAGTRARRACEAGRSNFSTSARSLHDQRGAPQEHKAGGARGSAGANTRSGRALSMRARAKTTSAGVRLRGASTSGGRRGARALTRRTPRQPLSDAGRLAPASRRYGRAAAASAGARRPVLRQACASQPPPRARRQRPRHVELVACAERESPSAGPGRGIASVPPNARGARTRTAAACACGMSTACATANRARGGAHRRARIGGRVRGQVVQGREGRELRRLAVTGRRRVPAACEDERPKPYYR
jgi:hypothetical protein